MAKNFDWHYGHGLLMTNPRNIQKTALVSGLDTPLLWNSKYGSVTFNQLGREMPYGGMNEKGLSIEILWLSESEYPKLVPGIQTVNEVQWIQTLLDQASSISEMESLIKGFQVHPAYAKVHYFACDASKHCAIFEYLNSKLVITHLNSPADLQIITNNSRESSQGELKKFKSFGGTESPPHDGSSLSRYVLGATLLKNREPSHLTALDRAFKILDQVSDDSKVWSIVYDPAELKIYFKTRSEPRVKSVALSTVDYDCHSKPKILNINTSQKQDVSSHFEDESQKALDELAEKSLFVPPQYIDKLKTSAAQDHCL